MFNFFFSSYSFLNSSYTFSSPPLVLLPILLLPLLPLLFSSSASPLSSSFLFSNLLLLLLPLLHPSFLSPPTSSSPSSLYFCSTSYCASISFSRFTSFLHSFSPSPSSSCCTPHQSSPHHTTIPFQQHCALRYVSPFITSHCSPYSLTGTWRATRTWRTSAGCRLLTVPGGYCRKERPPIRICQGSTSTPDSCSS